jgi:hypothetical protein
MADQNSDTVAQIVAQCRRDIEAAWNHVQAAREVLHRTRPLQERWQEQLAAAAVAPEPVPHLRSEGFVMIPRAPGHHNRRRLVSGS